MAKRLLSVFAFVAALVLTSANFAQEKKEFKCNCPVSGKPAKEASFVEYKGSKVYFCCDNCPSAFKKDTAKFSTKANQQLVITGQFIETKCPIAGRDLNPATAIDVQGAQVCFCCNNCKAKASKAEGAAQLELIFADKTFDKSFAKKK
jgi:YHS domain-containing protein